jgi:hypothetical protein
MTVQAEVLVPLLNTCARRWVLENAPRMLAAVPSDVRDGWRRTLTANAARQFGFTEFLRSQSSDDLVGEIHVDFMTNVEVNRFYRVRAPLLPMPDGWWRRLTTPEHAEAVIGNVLRASYHAIFAYVIDEWYAGKIKEVVE